MTESSKEGTSEKKYLSENVFFWRPKWFIITRFFAVLGVIVALFFSKFIFKIETINYSSLWVLTSALLILNIGYFLYYNSIKKSRPDDSEFLNKKIFALTVTQINTDLIILTLMLHFSGGATNPFVFYYFFHTILSSILLSKKAAYAEAIFAAVLFNGMALLEGMKIIGHFPLITRSNYTEPVFVIGICFALTSALIIAVYMATSVMERLRGHQLDLEKALEETERLEEEKSRFLDVVAHDLKSPLASIETMITSTLSVYGNEIPPKIKQVLERIPKRTNSLLNFIQELLDFSKINDVKQLKIQMKPINFLPIITATVEIYMTEALDKNIKITLNAQPNIPPVMGNVDHLERMVSNLLSNAIHYTPEFGSVNVKIETEDGFITLSVADTGIGIPEIDLPNIFNDFFRARNARKVFSAGTGLGLSITKAIVENHGGTITANSTEGEGTVFTVRIPAYIPKSEKQ
jgi:signal transduction histidine kinase